MASRIEALPKRSLVTVTPLGPKAIRACLLWVKYPSGPRPAQSSFPSSLDRLLHTCALLLRPTSHRSKRHHNLSRSSWHRATMWRRRRIRPLVAYSHHNTSPSRIPPRAPVIVACSSTATTGSCRWIAASTRAVSVLSRCSPAWPVVLTHRRCLSPARREKGTRCTACILNGVNSIEITSPAVITMLHAQKTRERLPEYAHPEVCAPFQPHRLALLLVLVDITTDIRSDHHSPYGLNSDLVGFCRGLASEWRQALPPTRKFPACRG